MNILLKKGGYFEFAGYGRRPDTNKEVYVSIRTMTFWRWFDLTINFRRFVINTTLFVRGKDVYK